VEKSWKGGILMTHKTIDTPRLSEKFTLAISLETKQRIKKLPREVQLGAHLRAALDEILDEVEKAT